MRIVFQIILVLVAISFSSKAICEPNEIEQRFINAGLVDVNSIDNSIQIDLVNSDPSKNYFRENFYDGLNRAYLQKEVALKLAKAQQILKARFPDYSLLIMDSARPRSVSVLMYEKMKGTKYEKYVANPKKGSMHNYGIAVDITIVNKDGEKLDMGFTPFYKSEASIYWQFIKMKLSSKISPEQSKNRKLLSDVMIGAGFKPLNFEWWHFNGMPKQDARKKYKIIE
jgi:D-alanyl-D-alanine dipeptidase